MITIQELHKLAPGLRTLEKYCPAASISFKPTNPAAKAELRDTAFAKVSHEDRLFLMDTGWKNDGPCYWWF